MSAFCPRANIYGPFRKGTLFIRPTFVASAPMAHWELQAMVNRRGQYIGKRVDGGPDNEAEHFMRCPRCGGLVDMRDLGQVLSMKGR